MAILAIYPHASTLHVAIKADELSETIAFKLREDFDQIIEEDILPWLAQARLSSADLRLIVTSGHLPTNSPSGLYALSDLFLQSGLDNPGATLAHALVNRFRLPAYIIDPSSQKECHNLALVTGSPEFARGCRGDTFVFKYLVRLEALKRSILPSASQYIVAHLDEEIQIGALRGTSVIDVGTSVDEGPFSLGQGGGLPFDRLLDFCIDTKDRARVLRIIGQESGLKGYLGLQDFKDLYRDPGENATLVRDALVYQIGKEIGAYATVLKGQIHGILLTGELTKYEPLLQALTDRIGFIGEISVYPGNHGLPALFAGAERILDHEPILVRGEWKDGIC